MNEIRYFSMFTGVGGFELGFQYTFNNGKLLSGQKPENLQQTIPNTQERSSRFACIGFSEIDKYCSQLLSNRFPNIRNYGDCTKINPGELPDFDMLCGGFPCQSFSIAGKRRGFEDTRGTMFFEVARILEVKRPKVVFLENVKGLLNHNKGETFSVILQTLDELGYEVQWMVLNSKFFGVPQNRERVFIIGNLRGTSRPEILPFRENCEKTYELYNECTNTLTRNYDKGQANGSYITESKQLSQANRVYNADGISPTVPTSSGGRHIPMINQNIKIRRLTPIECERLQGFPDNWTAGFSDTQRYKMMGNAVTVNVISAITRRLLDGI